MLRLRRNSLIIVLFFLFCAPYALGQSTAATTPARQASEQKAETKFNVEDFTFNVDQARNPFEPVLLLKAKTARGVAVRTSRGEKAEPDKIGYRLEELRLVGVIRSDKGMIAMMEDAQGKGIFFRKGDHLNSNMWVSEISASNVVLSHKTRGETRQITVDIPAKN